jgi:ribosomal protein S1
MSHPEHTSSAAGWADFVARYGVGDVVDGQVVSVVPFGAFVRVGDGVDGLAPQQMWPTVPAAGARVAARIVAIDPDNHRVSLGPA